ncbi:MAG TPA: DegV family protein [Actinomycetota bacterium]|jgi:DegV family protein with EDD domain
MIAVVADSAADLPPGLAPAISIVPLTVRFGSNEFRDGVDLPATAFWERVDAGPEFPTTASPPPAALLEAYRAAAERGAAGVVSVHVSGKLSRTAESARMAGGEAPLPVEVVDSRSVSLGEGLVALAASEAAEAGGDLAAVAATARGAVARLEVYALLETVDFLRRGGRVGRAKAAVTDLLRIRPILSVEDGEPVLVARARTRGRALDEVLERAAGPAEAAGVLHGGASEASEVAARVREACGVEPIVTLIGAVTGTHLGPAALGVAVLRPESTLASQ